MRASRFPAEAISYAVSMLKFQLLRGSPQPLCLASYGFDSPRQIGSTVQREPAVAVFRGAAGEPTSTEHPSGQAPDFLLEAHENWSLLDFDRD
jgi:hypothetical protein